MPENSLTLPSYAKINWHLRILGRRDDGFHELLTIFQTISLHDRLSFETAGELILTCDNSAVPTDERNLIIKAAKALRENFNCRKGAKIHLQKRIPAPGGLGGGSSNAAVALLALNKIWNLKADLEDLRKIAAAIGSDVPFFLSGGTAVGKGRGTEIEQTEDLSENFLLVAAPLIDVPTAEAFNRLNASRLTNSGSKSILKICLDTAQKLKSGQAALENDFERSVFAIEPEIGEIKKTLLGFGAKQALLSGSGASVFAVFDKEETRQATIKAIERTRNWRMFAVATIAREQYRAALAAVF